MTMNVIQEGYSYGFFWVMTSFQIMASFWLVTRMRVYSTMTECRLFGRKWQDYVYIQCEYKSTKPKIKHLLREENKVKENKIS